MSILASEVLDGVSLTLVDVARVTWTETELLGYLNEALRATAFVKPDTVTTQAFVTLDAGVLQNLPDGGVALINVLRNASGRVVTEVDQQLLDEVQRFWPAGTQETVIEHYTADSTTPRQFNVYPPSDGTSSVLIKYGIEPPEVTATTDELPVVSTYQNALTNFVLARAYAKNTKRQDLVKAAGAMQDWARAVGAKSQAQVAISPKVASQPGVS